MGILHKITTLLIIDLSKINKDNRNEEELIR